MPPRIVLYDGLCALCKRTMQWLLDRDGAGKLCFAPLQGETAARLRARHPEIPATIESMVYVEEGRVYLRSKALFHATRHLRRPWHWAAWLRWLPAFPMDLVYRLVARVRYAVGGKYETCRLPTTPERARLLP